MDTYKFAFFLGRWFYLGEIAVSNFARYLTVRTIAVWFRRFGFLTRRNRRATITPGLDSRNTSPRNIPRCQRGTRNCDVRLAEGSALFGRRECVLTREIHSKCDHVRSPEFSELAMSLIRSKLWSSYAHNILCSFNFLSKTGR